MKSHLALFGTVSLSLSCCRLSGLKAPELLQMAALELFNTQLFCFVCLFYTPLSSRLILVVHDSANVSGK